MVLFIAGYRVTSLSYLSVALSLTQVKYQRLEWSDVFRLRAFLPLGHFHGYFLAFLKRASPRAIDGAEMYEYIFAAFLLDKAETLLVVKPLYCTLNCL